MSGAETVSTSLIFFLEHRCVMRIIYVYTYHIYVYNGHRKSDCLSSIELGTVAWNSLHLIKYTKKVFIRHNFDTFRNVSVLGMHTVLSSSALVNCCVVFIISTHKTSLILPIVFTYLISNYSTHIQLVEGLFRFVEIEIVSSSIWRYWLRIRRQR